MVPEVGLEPTWALSPLDFESSAYTNFATPAANFDYKSCTRRASRTALGTAACEENLANRHLLVLNFVLPDLSPTRPPASFPTPFFTPA